MLTLEINGATEELSLKSRYLVRLLDATGGSVKTFEQIGRTYLPGNSTGGDALMKCLTRYRLSLPC